MTKVLLIDDHPDLREARRLQCSRWVTQVITAKNGREGVETAIIDKPDLILMDFIRDGWLGGESNFASQS
jgi:CheY-like chemotaxis protein